MNKRDELAKLLAGNAVLFHNLLISDAEKLEEMVDEELKRPDADPNTDSVWATQRDASFRRDLAAKIYAIQAGIDAETASEHLNKTVASEAELKNLIRDPAYWRDQDPELVERVRTGYRALYRTE